MARESKAKRDARRFGRPETMADMAINWAWREDPKSRINLDGLIAICAAAKNIEATNVYRYFMEMHNKEWGWWNLPALRLSFNPTLVEYPYFLPEEAGSRSQKETQLGVIFIHRRDISEFLDDYRRFGIGDNLATKLHEDIPLIESRCRHIYDFAMLMAHRGQQWLAHICGGSLFLDEQFAMIRAPVVQVTKNFVGIAREPEQTKRFLQLAITPSLLALSFMNCKNVTVQPHDPNPAINRERHKARLKPFVRYHTINIEPMKQVLRTEGGVESNGLKKALHICRGHFATYTTSLMGRTLEKPVTVWKPAHVRGSAKQGIVVSDYSVKAPEEPRP
jgi:hypothetical protein